jgi:hypothetical protein
MYAYFGFILVFLKNFNDLKRVTHENCLKFPLRGSTSKGGVKISCFPLDFIRLPFPLLLTMKMATWSADRDDHELRDVDDPVSAGRGPHE